ncbi:S9 family peptidase [Aliikangiella sp. G2MR2-5]|uniref:S9 family peptidase n=1 Tax=Aliikangiella sp. G2MR2-5 TaxID=2788943 RepID=UPI0018AB4895|nr:S9 family peptidase [Aliikangiella sp. G2MR2-5]
MHFKLTKFSCLLIALVFAFNVEAKKQVMTLEQTVEARSVRSVSVSPNGLSTAYTLSVPRDVYAEKDGASYLELHLIDSKGNSRRFITGKVAVSSIAWSPDSQYIYYLAKRNDDKYKSIYRIAVDGGESEKIISTKNDISNFSINFDGRKLVYLAKPGKDKNEKKLKDKGFKAKVYEESIELASAYLVDLENLKNEHEKLDIRGHVHSVKSHPKKDELLIRVSPTALIDDNYVASQYQVVDFSGKVKTRFETEGKLGNASWSKDGKLIAIIGAAGKHDPAAGRLFVGEVTSGKLSEPVKNYQGHVRSIQWLSEYQLAFLGHVGTKSQVSILNVDNNKVTTRVAAGDLVLTSLSADHEGKLLAGTASSDSTPSEVFYFFQNQTKRMTVSNPWLEDILMPKQETITYKARDGMELEGVLIYPLNYKKNKKYPLIMMVHGGPESHISDGWLDRYSYPIKHAAGQGFAVFLPNYRGSTGRGVDFSKLGQADYAGAEFNDLVDAIEHLSETGLIDKKKVGITGGSYGGYASAWAATALSEHFAASVMFVGISNQLSKFGTTDIPKEMYNVHARNYPWDKWQWMLERSPIYHTDKAKTPILIMHGENDTRVHPSQSMELYRYIKTRTDTPARLVLYPGEPHGNRKAAAQMDYSMRLMRWMNYYLKGKNKGKTLPPYELDHKSKLKEDKE